MIRLRCEFGPRRRQAVDYDHSGDPDWVEAALRCAALQAQSLITEGRRLVPLSFLEATGWGGTALSLYADGILELVSWEESGAGEIKRVLRADLSLKSARTLAHLGRLPRCFVSALVAADLLGEVSAGPSHFDSDLLLQEFFAWLDCSEFFSEASFGFDKRDRSFFAGSRGA